MIALLVRSMKPIKQATLLRAIAAMMSDDEEYQETILLITRRQVEGRARKASAFEDVR